MDEPEVLTPEVGKTVDVNGRRYWFAEPKPIEEYFFPLWQDSKISGSAKHIQILAEMRLAASLATPPKLTIDFSGC